MIFNRIQHIIQDFMKLIDRNKIQIYNEFSFQHELGIYLRENIEREQYLVQFERNVSFFMINKEETIKKEIDIVIYNTDKTEKYAIELKYPLNGQYPETMYSFIKDIKFCEQLADNGFNGAISVVAVGDKLFYDGTLKEGIYKYFRNSKPILGRIDKPTGNQIDSIYIDGKYVIDWKAVDSKLKYYLVAIETSKEDPIIGVEKLDINEAKNVRVDEGLYDKSCVSGNLGVNAVSDYIRDILCEAKKNDKHSITLISGEVHKELGLSNAMPTVCGALRKVVKEYPESIIIKPDHVKENSSTIRAKFKLN